ncbi:MAG: phage protein Gp27 family protein [Cyanobacteria bacterium P01_H01_bin.130]
MTRLVADGRFKVCGLPPHVREEIDRFLISGNFRNYAELHARVNELLAQEDLEMAIAKSSLIRYGARLRQAVQRLRNQVFVLQELRRDWDDGADVAAGAGLQLVLSELVARLADGGEELSVKELLDLGRAIAEVRQLQDEVAGAGLKGVESAINGGLRAETLRTIDATILGIAGAEEPGDQEDDG